MSEHRPVRNESGEVMKAGCLVQGEQGHYLLIRDPRQEHWGLPKGHVEPGETPKAAAVREVEEETGYEARLVREIPPMAYVNSESGESIYTYLWLAEVVRQVGPGTARHAWFTLAEAREVAFPNVVELLDELKRDGVIK